MLCSRPANAFWSFNTPCGVLSDFLFFFFFFKENLWILKVWRKSREQKDTALVNLMKHSEDQLLFYCGGSQKPSQRVVWVHVRVSSFTA